MVPSIKSTVEKEENDSIAFLDVTVIRHDNSFKFKVHRKATNNNLIINAYSSHSESVKQSALRSMFLRAHHVCSPEYFDEEVNNIYEIGYRNNFKKHQIDHCLDLAKRTFYNREIKETNSNYISFPYHPLLKDIEYPLKLLGFNVAFSYHNTIGRNLICNSPDYKEGIVYKIPCGCGKIYIGQSGKSLEKRISQHKYSIRSDNERSAVNVHARNCNFPMKWKESTEIFSRKDFIERNVIESACIYHTREIHMNSNLGLYKLDPVVLHIFKQQYKLKEVLDLT